MRRQRQNRSMCFNQFKGLHIVIESCHSLELQDGECSFDIVFWLKSVCICMFTQWFFTQCQEKPSICLPTGVRPVCFSFKSKMCIANLPDDLSLAGPASYLAHSALRALACEVPCLSHRNKSSNLRWHSGCECKYGSHADWLLAQGLSRVWACLHSLVWLTLTPCLDRKRVRRLFHWHVSPAHQLCAGSHLSSLSQA